MIYNNIIYNNLIFFLGLYSWNFKHNTKLESYINKKNINNFNYIKNKTYNNIINSSQYKNKHLVEYNQTDSNSPSLNLYILTPEHPL